MRKNVLFAGCAVIALGLTYAVGFAATSPGGSGLTVASLPAEYCEISVRNPTWKIGE